MLLQDTVFFLRALRGEHGAERRTSATRIMRLVRKRVISWGEGIEVFFDRESDDSLMVCVFIILADKKYGGGVHKILRSQMSRSASIERALADLMRHKEERCDDLKRAIFTK